MTKGHYSLAELEAMPTLNQGWTADLKIDTGTERVWLERLEVADGVPFDNMVTVEKYNGHAWITVRRYQAV